LTDPFDLFSLVDDGTSPTSKLFEDVPPGSYAFTTTSYPGGSFSLTDISCDDANSTDINVDGTNGGSLIINVEAGETVTCTFTNTKNPEPETGTIIIIKDTVPNNGQDFEFFTSGLSPESFMLDDDADPTLSNTQTFTNVPAGSYEVGEAVDNFVPAPGYEISSIECVDPTNDTFVSIPSAFIDLSAGETVTCTFTNRLINADLEVKVEESDFSLAPEQYFVAPEYINHGPDTAENVSLTVTLPTGIVVVDVTGCNNTPVVIANQFVCELGIVASGANGFIDIEFFLDNPSLTSLEFLAEISSDTPDLVPGNNTDSNSFLLPAPELIDLFATKLRDDKVGSVSFVKDERLAGWEFTLYDVSNTQIAQAVTDANGVADLGSHPAGTYTWCETPMSGWENTIPGASTDPDPEGLGRPCITNDVPDTISNSSQNFWNYEIANQAPQITSYGGANPASDTVLSGASLVENLAATDDFDSEGAGLTWSITGGADGGGSIFGILPTTGVLVFNFFADFNNPQDVNGDNIYEVEVTVTDSGGLSDSLIINIEVIEAP
ncbi:MAG: hypothetical protein KC422_12820, partial [Trueperaceae bacterium]|nr:hypothetical protein [Trueperaceae bacterium]